MKPTNAMVTKREKKPFSAVISGEGAQKLIRASLRDDGAVKRFTGTLISAVNASQQLSQCEPGSIISAALRGEGAGLIYGHGYYVVPYGSVASYLTSYKGYLQLAIATGLYADIDCIAVHEGEKKGRDKRTGKPIIDMSVYDDDAERDKHPVIGYKAYFELKDGYFREEYWTVDELLRHADRYSPAFSLDLYTRWKNGETLSASDQRTVENGSPWYTSTERMMKKTVLRSLLTSGFAPLSNETKSLLDRDPISGEAVLPDFGDDVVPDYSVIESTGEVVEEPQDAAPSAEIAEVLDAEPPQKVRRAPREKAQSAPPADAEDFPSFFGDDE